MFPLIELPFLTANLNGGLELQQVGLAHEDLLGREAQLPDLLLCQLDLLARAPVANIKQAVDDVIEKSLLLQQSSNGAALEAWPWKFLMRCGVAQNRREYSARDDHDMSHEPDLSQPEL